MRVAARRRSPKKCCVTDKRGKTIACFTGKDASARAAALQQIVKKSRTQSSCQIGGRA